MNILVTGGAGFIGSHLVDALIAAKHAVTVIDDLSYGHKEYLSPQATFVQQSITDPKVTDVIAHGSFDTLIHCAAQKNARYSFEDPVHDAETNVIGFLRLLEASRKAGVKNVILLSTGGVMYSESTVIPTPETESPTPSSPYAVSKLAGETYVALYARQYNMKGISLRLANVFGPRQDPKGEAGVVAIFLEALLQGKPIHIYGDGAQTRDYMYVSDSIAAIQATLKSIDEIPSGQYNIGTGQETSVNTIADLVVAAGDTQTKATIEHGDPVTGDQPRSAVDSTLFQQLTGWAPQTSVREGIEQTATWFFSQHSNH